MATTPTQLPVPSEKPQDLKFNAGKIDEFVTSMGWTYTDRFGNKHYTIEGINYLAQQVMSAFGYITLTGVDFDTGATVSTPNEVLFNPDDNSYYKWTGSFASGGKVVPVNSTPESTGGIGPGKWLNVGDAALRSELAGSDGYLLIPSMDDHIQMLQWRDAGDIRGWGCVCDGVEDDSDNFQAAIDYSELNDTSIFIPGKVRITKKITFNKPPQIRGYKYSPPVMGQFQGTPYAHTGCIIYSEVPSGYCIDINPPSNNKYIRGLDIVDIHVLARGVGVDGQGVRISNCGWGGYTKGFVIEGFKNGGLTSSQLQDTLFDQLEILNCGTDNVAPALNMINGCNLITFIRPRLEANGYQMRINSGFGFDFVGVHFEQGDYPNASAGPEFQRINATPSIRLESVDNVKFIGGSIFGATLQQQISVLGLTAATAPFHIAIDGACTDITFSSATMGFGYGSGKIMEMHGDGIISDCTFKALCTEYQPIFLDANINYHANRVAYIDNQSSDIFILMGANKASIEDNLFTCLNSSSINKTSSALFIGNTSTPARLGMNQFVISKYSLFTDGSPICTNQSRNGVTQVTLGAMEMRKYDPNKTYAMSDAGNVTSIGNLLAEQEAKFLNTSSGNVTFKNGASLSCKGSVDAVVPPGCYISFIFNGFTGSVTESSRSF